MVQEEFVAHRVLRHVEAHAAAVSATRDLSRAAPWLREPGPGAFNRDEASDYWRKAYGRLFEILDTSGDAARQALLREANCEKPAKGPDAKDKGGARDAAIWLSAVEYLKGNPDEKAFFVTGNTRDFGDGSEFPAPMSDDIKGIEDRLQVLTSFDSVVSEFSTPLDIDEEDTERDLADLLTSDTALSLLAGAVRDILAADPGLRGGNAVRSFLPEVGPSGGYPQINWSTWASDPKVILRIGTLLPLTCHLSPVTCHLVTLSPCHLSSIADREGTVELGHGHLKIVSIPALGECQSPPSGSVSDY
jgi:hypothetical protein